MASVRKLRLRLSKKQTPGSAAAFARPEESLRKEAEKPGDPSSGFFLQLTAGLALPETGF